MSPLNQRHTSMDKDRIKGSVKQAKGTIKVVAGKVTGDAKLVSEGKADKFAGKVQNAVGGAKDALRGK
jgi:uncharacterized protein YjbJ (UPF0337 family)